MKIPVQMKDPDVLQDAILEAVTAEVDKLPLSADEKEAIIELRVNAVEKICAKWWKHGEYLTVEVDSEAQTCTVLSCKD